MIKKRKSQYNSDTKICKRKTTIEPHLQLHAKILKPELENLN